MPNLNLKGVITKINGIAPDENGNISVEVGGIDEAQLTELIEAMIGQPNGLAGLDSTGKLPSNIVPNLFLLEVNEASSQSAMLALNAQKGDLCLRTDLTKTFILAGTDPTVLSNWKEILFTITAAGISATDPTGEDGSSIQDVLNNLNMKISDTYNDINSTGASTIFAENPYGTSNNIGTVLYEHTQRISNLDTYTENVYTKSESDSRYRGINDPFEASETNTSGITNSGWLTNTQNVQAYFTSIVGKIDTMDTTIAGKANTNHTHNISTIIASNDLGVDSIGLTNAAMILDNHKTKIVELQITKSNTGHVHAASEITHDDSYTDYGATVQDALVSIKDAINDIYSGNLSANNITYLASQTVAQKIGAMDTAISTAQSTANTANTNAQTALNNIGTMANLTTSVTTSLVNAVNSLKSEINTLNTGVGTVGSLTTTATNVVGAVNELKGRIDTAESNITTNINNISTNTTNIATNTAAIGTLSSLTTTYKTDLVGAINEVRSTAVNGYGPTNKVPLSDVYTSGSAINPTGQSTTSTSPLPAAFWGFTPTSNFQIYGLVGDVSASGSFYGTGNPVIAEVRSSDTVTVLASSTAVTLVSGSNTFIFNEPLVLQSGTTYYIGFRRSGSTTSSLTVPLRFSMQGTSYTGFSGPIIARTVHTYNTGPSTGTSSTNAPNFSIIGTSLSSAKGISNKVAPSDILGAGADTGFVPRYVASTGSFVVSALRFDDLAGPMTTQFVSTLATGTPPFAVSSTTMVSNLNVQFLNGLSSSSFSQLSSANIFTNDQTIQKNDARLILNRPSGQTGQYARIRFDNNGDDQGYVGYDFTNSNIVLMDGATTPANIATFSTSDKSANFYGKLQVNGSNGNFYVDTTGNDVYFTRAGLNSIRTSGSGSSLNFLVNGNTPLTFNSDGTITTAGNITATGTFTVSRTNAKVIINRASGSAIQYTGVQITDNNTDVAYLVYDHIAGSIVISGAAPGTPIVTYTVSNKAATFAGQIVSSVVQGIAPFVVTSTTMVSNLNVERLGGQTGSYYNIQDIEDGVEGINTDLTLFRTLISRAQTITAVGGLTSVAQPTSFKISVQKNGTEVASVTFAAGATTTTSPTGFPVSFAVNDRLKIATIGMDGSTMRDLDYYVQRNQQ